MSINKGDARNFMFWKREAMSSQNLSKDFLRYLLASVLIKVLEKALAVKSVLFNDFLESKNDVVNDCAFFLARISTTVVGTGASIVN
jgi:hypothetical protein